MKFIIRSAAGALMLALAAQAGADTGSAPGADGEAVIRAYKDTREASVIRGSAVYKTYCMLCHGAEADGKGRAAKLYTPKPANLTLSRTPPQYVEAMVRRGGAGMGRSEFMPPWGQQLTDEQIADVINYLQTIRKSDD